MSIDLGDVNWLAIIVVAVAGYAVAGGWYGILRVPWMAEAGLTADAIKAAGSRNYVSYGVSAVAYFVAVLSLAIVMRWAGASGAVDGLRVGLMMWVGFYGLLLVTNHLYALRSVKLIWIDLGPPAITLGLGGLVLGVWE